MSDTPHRLWEWERDQDGDPRYLLHNRATTGPPDPPPAEGKEPPDAWTTPRTEDVPDLDAALVLLEVEVARNALDAARSALLRGEGR